MNSLEKILHAYDESDDLLNKKIIRYAAVTNISTPEQFGAVGDGVADDTAAVQTAFDKGGNILINGTYRCTKTVNITKSNTIIAGIGTIIGDFNTDGSVIACSASNDNRKDHIRVKDIEIRSSSTGAHNGIIFNHEITSGIGFTDVVIDGVTVDAVTGNGIHLHGGVPSSTTIRPFISIINCKIFNVKKVGICESRVSSRIQKCLIRGSGLENITVDNGCYLTVISDNILQTANGGVGNIGVDQCDRCIIANNQIVSFDYGVGHDSDYNCGIRCQCNTGNVGNIVVSNNVFTGGKYGIYLGNSTTGYSAHGIFNGNAFVVIGVSDFKFDKIGKCTIRDNSHNKFLNDEFKANISNITCDKPVIIPLSEVVQEGFELVGSDETDNRVVVTSEKISITARFNRANKASGDVPFVLPFTVSKGADFLEQEGNEVCLRTNGNVQMYGDYKNMGDDDTVQFSVTLPRFA
ncbi:MAG: hypothetical protein MJ095_00180 [Oscillospiraceae bacterium]|nr:hypothetical protein [Oscillospiraceae bacterium]